MVPSYTFPSGLRETLVPAGSRIVRVHRLENGALWYGPARGEPPVYRFDAQAGEYRTLYCAEKLTGVLLSKRCFVVLVALSDVLLSTSEAGRS